MTPLQSAHWFGVILHSIGKWITGRIPRLQTLYIGRIIIIEPQRFTVLILKERTFSFLRSLHVGYGFTDIAFSMSLEDSRFYG